MKEMSLPRICRTAAALTAIGVVPCFLLLPVGVGVGVLLGGLVAIVNFRWIEGSVDAMLPGSAARAARGALLRYGGRLLVTGAAVLAIAGSPRISPAGFVGGAATVVVAIVLETLRVGGRMQEEATG